MDEILSDFRITGCAEEHTLRKSPGHTGAASFGGGWDNGLGAEPWAPVPTWLTALGEGPFPCKPQSPYLNSSGESGFLQVSTSLWFQPECPYTALHSFPLASWLSHCSS